MSQRKYYNDKGKIIVYKDLLYNNITTLLCLSDDLLGARNKKSLFVNFGKQKKTTIFDMALNFYFRDRKTIKILYTNMEID